MHQASGHDLIKTQRAVGHSLPNTTARYLETDTADLDRSSSPLLPKPLP